MRTETPTPPSIDRDPGAAPGEPGRGLIGRITRFEIIVAAAVVAVLSVLVLVEPDIVEAPFENTRTLVFTIGGTLLATIALVAMLWLRVPPVVRVTVLVVPFAIVNWWLLSPHFVDDVVDEGFAASISDPSRPSDAVSPTGSAPPITSTPSSSESVEDEPVTPSEPGVEADPSPGGPVLLGAGQFIGLAGHSGTGDAGIFENPDGSLVLRFENFDIDNGPDLEVYLVPGPDQTSLAPGSIHLGALKGNVGDQNYDLPPGTELPPGPYTALVWCEAFTVEFVGATISV